MRTMALAILLIATTLPACADDVPAGGKACILKSAELLPRIPGLEIKGSKAMLVPSNAGWIRIDLNFVAAGQTETQSYLCAVGSSGDAVILGKMN
jgi:hypothetical protein